MDTSVYITSIYLSNFSINLYEENNLEKNDGLVLLIWLPVTYSCSCRLCAPVWKFVSSITTVSISNQCKGSPLPDTSSIANVS